MDEKRIARVFEDVGGFYFCDDALDYLDTRGRPYTTKAAAQRAAAWHGYTHGTGSGMYKTGLHLLPEVVKCADAQKH